MTASHIPSRSVLRMKPRRCAHHTYSIRASSESPTSSAILFSNPSSCAFENGRLFGSAQTRSTRRESAHAAATTTTAIAATLRKAVDMEHASLRGRVFQRFHRQAPARARRRVARVELVDDDGARPSADAGKNRHVLLAVWTAVGDRL